jgi:hypothetical protein
MGLVDINGEHFFEHNLTSDGVEFHSSHDFINLEDYRHFDGRLLSLKNGEAPIEMFINDHYDEIVTLNPLKDVENKKRFLNSLMTNVLIASENSQVVAISKNRNNYSFPKIYGLRHIKYEYVYHFVKRLTDLELIGKKNGYYSGDSKKSKLTRIWADNNLITEVGSYFTNSSNLILPVYSDYAGDKIIIPKSVYEGRQIPYATSIHLKNSDKKLIDYTKTMSRNVVGMKKFLDGYNELAMSCEMLSLIDEEEEQNLINNKYNNKSIITHSIQHKHPIPLLIQKHDKSIYHNKLSSDLHRVFNQSKFNLGGRFYGGEYQWIKSKLRNDILINGSATIEADFSSMHIQMLYGELGIQYDTDPYSDIIGIEFRDLMKPVSLMSINSANRISAIRAYNNELYKKRKRGNPKDITFLELHYRSGYTTTQLFEKFINYHNKLSNYFISGIGRELQYKDSLIAEKILKHFTKQGVLVAPVHDSFIVAEKYKDELVHVMKEAYKSQTGFDCNVKINGGK